MSSTELVKTDTTDFLDLAVPVLVDDEGEQYFSPRYICDALGLGWSSQYKRIKRTHLLKEVVTVMTTVAADGKKRKVAVLPISRLAGWLMCIQPSRCKPELRDQMRRYRAEAFAVLNAWFMKGGRKAIMSGDNSFDMKAAVNETLKKELARFEAAIEQGYIDVEAAKKELKP